MKTFSPNELDRLLETVSDRVSVLRDLDLSKDAQVQYAEEVSQRLIGVLAVYRHRLTHLAA